MTERHRKLGKDYKKHITQAQSELDKIESELMAEALKLPNFTHPDAPVGDKNKIIYERKSRKIR